MFVGHYACAFILRKRAEPVPLWLLFLSVQLADIVAFLFILLGIERIAYSPNPNPFLRTILEYVPFSHSLFGNVGLALVVLLLFWKFKGFSWGLILCLGVLSHWFLDAVVHVRDLPLFLNRFKTGLGLWEWPWVAIH
ncbi:MAG: hypothetical protein JRF64_02355 [Deltaproteobacteria bacterium]|nr:hypothetical protein [Deltaproteobacteria bacterium]